MSSMFSGIVWLWGLLKELGYPQQSATLLHENAIQIAYIPIFHEKTKYIKVDCHYIQEGFDDKIITLPHNTTDLQVANIFTKAVPHVKHQFFVGKIDVDWITSIKLRGEMSMVLETTILVKYLFWFHDYKIPRVIRKRSQKREITPMKKGIRLLDTCCI